MSLIIGLFIGAFFGVFIMCLMSIARDPNIGLGDEEPVPELKHRLDLKRDTWDD